MQDKITRWPVGSLQHTLSGNRAVSNSRPWAHPYADRGVRISPADFPFIHHRMVGFCLITALVLSQNYATTEWHWSGIFYL